MIRNSPATDDGTIPAPAVSILMPVRNEALFLEAALASIMPPPDLSCEVILADDGSTDGSAAIATAFAARAPFSLRIVSAAGAGKTAAFNLGYAMARSESFILLGGDDLLVSEALCDRIAAVAGAGPRLAQCRYRTFTESVPGETGTDYPRSPHHDHLAGGAISFNRAFAELCFPLPEDLVNEDTWIRATMIAYGIDLAFVDHLGLYYRIHDGNSVGPRRSFAETDQNLQLRHRAFSLALERFRNVADASGISRLERLVRAEQLRVKRRWIGLMFMSGLHRHDRLTMLANATPWLYHLKVRLLPALSRILRRLCH